MLLKVTAVGTRLQAVTNWLWNKVQGMMDCSVPESTSTSIATILIILTFTVNSWLGLDS